MEIWPHRQGQYLVASNQRPSTKSTPIRDVYYHYLSSNATEQYFNPLVFPPLFKGAAKTLRSRTTCARLCTFSSPLLQRMPTYTIELVSIAGAAKFPSKLCDRTNTTCIHRSLERIKGRPQFPVLTSTVPDDGVAFVLSGKYGPPIVGRMESGRPGKGNQRRPQRAPTKKHRR